MSARAASVRAMQERRVAIGGAGEDAALSEYRRRGYGVLARNWRCRIGELDLVLSRGDTLVFCEVKTRRGGAFGAGYEAVTARKQAKLRAVAQAFLQANPTAHASIRFDVASVSVRAGAGGLQDRSSVQLFQDAF
jgi:putative endonuclease